MCLANNVAKLLVTVLNDLRLNCASGQDEYHRYQTQQHSLFFYLHMFLLLKEQPAVYRF